MRKVPHEAFILAAGKGTRLRPYTDTMPKPMVRVWGKPILEHTINKLQEFGIDKIIINLHYLGDMIESYFSNTNEDKIIFSKEKDLLDTGGGIKYARHHLSDAPIFIINGDAFWTDGNNGSLFENLSSAWDENKMDILILLQPVAKMTVTQGVGDYDLDAHGRAIRNLDKNGAYMFGGIRIAKPSLLDDISDDCFSFLRLMDDVQNKGTLYGLVHDGEWHHISTPEDLENVNALKETSAA